MYTGNMANVPKQAKKPDTLRWVPFVAGGVFVITLAIVIWLHQNKPVPITNTNQAAAVTIPTPESYSDFVGSVVSYDNGTLVVRMRRSTAEGGAQNQNYTVTVTDQTELRTIEIGSATTNIDQLNPATLKPDDIVQVYADTNIAETPTFSATRILKLVQID
jgi:hypothetical protein